MLKRFSNANTSLFNRLVIKNSIALGLSSSKNYNTPLIICVKSSKQVKYFEASFKKLCTVPELVNAYRYGFWLKCGTSSKENILWSLIKKYGLFSETFNDFKRVKKDLEKLTLPYLILYETAVINYPAPSPKIDRALSSMDDSITPCYYLWCHIRVETLKEEHKKYKLYRSKNKIPKI
ncbi:hypothetical protein AGLY_007957 [Aphis glycines]|uniref:Uncharacterized protein n=1 Tax=Aphis glycines TaxID=307491 RepID=A0A6G0TLT3_APHGL|nr:hypothetical protein AGLY_007957 [Aphis glycines]